MYQPKFKCLYIWYKANWKKILSGGIEPPFRDSESHVITTTLQEICECLKLKNNLSKKSIICEIEIFYNGNIEKIKTMIDTGNLLKEPISKKDVVIVEKDSLKSIISKDILDNIQSILHGQWLESENLHSYKLNLIPFSSLGNDNGLLIGFKPDYIKIYSEEECVRNDVLIGIYDGKLSKNNLYTSLIGLDILSNRKGKNKWICLKD